MKKNLQEFVVAMTLSDFSFEIKVNAFDSKHALKIAEQFNREYLTVRKSMMYNELILLSTSPFKHYAKPERYKKSPLLNKGIFIDCETAQELIKVIDDVNEDLAEDGGQSKRKFALLLFPFYRLTKDIKDLVKSIFQLFYSLLSAKKTVQKNIDDVNNWTSDKDESLGGELSKIERLIPTRFIWIVIPILGPTIIGLLMVILFDLGVVAEAFIYVYSFLMFMAAVLIYSVMKKRVRK